MTVGGDFRPHVRVIDPALSRLDETGVDRRQMFGEPAPHLLQESFRIVKQAIDQIDDLAFEALGARCQALADDLGRISGWIEDGQSLSHRHLPTALSDHTPSVRYRSTAIAAAAPSPAEPAARQGDPDRTVPAAQMPANSVRIQP